MHKMMVLISALVLVGAAQSEGAQSERQGRSIRDRSVCDRWSAMVDPHVHSNSKPAEVNEISDEEATEGVACLLAFEGSRRVGKFSGATRLDISQTFPDASVELDALYVISAIYNRRWQHARGIALVDEMPKILQPGVGARRAFPFVKRWYQRAKEDGLEKLRSEHDDPLSGSGLRWY